MIVGCKVQIIEILDDSFFSGICKVSLEDSENRKHYFIDKLPVFGRYLDEIEEFPCEGIMRVERLEEINDTVKINTLIPDDIESEDNGYIFTVLNKIICNY